MHAAASCGVVRIVFWKAFAQFFGRQKREGRRRRRGRRLGSHTSALVDRWSRSKIPGAAPPDRALVDRYACSATPDHRPSRRTLPSSIAVSRVTGPLSLASERIGAHTHPVASLTRRAPTRGPVDPSFRRTVPQGQRHRRSSPHRDAEPRSALSPTVVWPMIRR